LRAGAGFLEGRDGITIPLIAAYLAAHPALVEMWKLWSMDKRTTSGWYFAERRARLPSAPHNPLRSTMISISTIRSRYYEAARRVGAPEDEVVFATRPDWDGRPYVERRGDAYAYVVSERGVEHECRLTEDPDDILYWLVSSLTFSMATEYELNHRREGQDSRRIWIDKHLELLALADPRWAARKRLEYDQLLREHPFVDDPGSSPKSRWLTQPLPAWSLRRVVLTGVAWIFTVQLIILWHDLVRTIALVRANPGADVHLVGPHVPGGSLVLIGPPLILGGVWWWLRRPRPSA
jgi:hypothetical protein